MPDADNMEPPSPDRLERRANSPWFLPLPHGDRSIRPLPEMLLLLDADDRILRISDRFCGERLRRFPFEPGKTPHEALHPGCREGDCNVRSDWSRAKHAIRSGLPVEWLYHSPARDAFLRLRLQPVGYACGILYEELVETYGDDSVLFIQDMSSAATQSLDSARRSGNPENTARIYKLRRATDPDPLLVASLDDRLRTITGRLLIAHEEERKRIARELHDGLGQSLSLLRFELEACLSRQCAETGDASDTVGRALDLAKRALGEVREIARNLRPTVINEHGLFGAIEVLGRDFRVVCPDVDLVIDLSGCPTSVPDELAIAVYRIVQEGLNNIARHAHAQRAEVRCSSGADGVGMIIRDDGIGLPEGPTRRRGLGLITMRERTEALGGTCEFESKPREGCTVILKWPREALDSMR